MEQNVIFEWIPLCCSNCHKWGHKTLDCWLKPKINKVWKPKQVQPISEVLGGSSAELDNSGAWITVVRGPSKTVVVAKPTASPSRFAVLQQTDKQSGMISGTATLVQEQLDNLLAPLGTNIT
ncbi:hypothetical protein Droror1_Dr00022150 [Drosera rotundifolia]